MIDCFGVGIVEEKRNVVDLKPKENTEVIQPSFWRRMNVEMGRRRGRRRSSTCCGGGGGEKEKEEGEAKESIEGATSTFRHEQH